MRGASVDYDIYLFGINFTDMSHVRHKSPPIAKQQASRNFLHSPTTMMMILPLPQLSWYIVRVCTFEVLLVPWKHSEAITSTSGSVLPSDQPLILATSHAERDNLLDKWQSSLWAND